MTKSLAAGGSCEAGEFAEKYDERNQQDSVHADVPHGHPRAAFDSVVKPEHPFILFEFSRVARARGCT